MEVDSHSRSDFVQMKTRYEKFSAVEGQLIVLVCVVEIAMIISVVFSSRLLTRRSLEQERDYT